jgi:histidinol-phosphatase
VGGHPGEFRDFATVLADVADTITLAGFGGIVPAETKADGSPVTAVDRSVEAALRDRIAVTYPDHAILGEEEGGEIDQSVPTWVIDPIDATKNFMRGVPVFATLIGLVQEGRATVGVASAPALGERWVAAVGEGAFRNGEHVRVSGIAEFSDAHVCHGGLDAHRELDGGWERLGRIADLAWRTRGFGDFWMHLLVAGGMADVAFEPELSTWDVAALACILPEAGGRMTSWDGGDPLVNGSSVLSTNGLLHERTLELLR